MNCVQTGRQASKATNLEIDASGWTETGAELSRVAKGYGSGTARERVRHKCQDRWASYAGMMGGAWQGSGSGGCGHESRLSTTRVRLQTQSRAIQISERGPVPTYFYRESGCLEITTTKCAMV